MAKLLLFFLCGLLHAASPESAVKSVLEVQAAAWNRGDLVEFVKPYDAEAIFVGKEVTRGSDGVLERYRRNYGTREKMGTLEFSQLEVKMLGPDFASVIGRFHLARTKEGGGDSSGIFTLLFKRTKAGWMIILDHTS